MLTTYDGHQGTQHHSLSNASRNHNTMPISEYQALPSSVLEIRELCNEHNERFQLYCKEHEWHGVMVSGAVR
jgi:hypothetical protein